jgi:hypothetical protein
MITQQQQKVNDESPQHHLAVNVHDSTVQLRGASFDSPTILVIDYADAGVFAVGVFASGASGAGRGGEVRVLARLTDLQLSEARRDAQECLKVFGVCVLEFGAPNEELVELDVLVLVLVTHSVVGRLVNSRLQGVVVRLASRPTTL